MIKLISYRICLFTLILFCLISCHSANKMCNQNFTTNQVLINLSKEIAIKFGAKSEVPIEYRKWTRLHVYNRSCNLNLNVDSILQEVSLLSTFCMDSAGIRNKEINIELCRFRNENFAKKVYKLIQPNAKEVRETPRNELGKMCVWPYETQIAYVFRSNCDLIFFNLKGYTPEEIKVFFDFIKDQIISSDL